MNKTILCLLTVSQIFRSALIVTNFHIIFQKSDEGEYFNPILEIGGTDTLDG